MRSIDYSRLYEKTRDTDSLNLLAKIHEYKGRQDLLIRQKPVSLSVRDIPFTRNPALSGDPHKKACQFLRRGLQAGPEPPLD